MNPIVIGLSGHLNTGKDTIANVFVESGYTKVAIADPIKRFLMQVFDFTEQQLWGPSYFRNQPDMRINWDKAEENIKGLAYLFVYGLVGNDVITTLSLRDELIECFNQLKELKYPSPRECLQLLGSEWGRDKVHQDVWLWGLKNTIRGLQPQTYDRTRGVVVGSQLCKFIVPDIRLENELQLFETNGWPVIRVVRSSTDTDSKFLSHVTETEQNGVDNSRFSAMVENTGTEEELVQKVKALIDVYSK